MGGLQKKANRNRTRRQRKPLASGGPTLRIKTPLTKSKGQGGLHPDRQQQGGESKRKKPRARQAATTTAHIHEQRPHRAGAERGEASRGNYCFRSRASLIRAIRCRGHASELDDFFCADSPRFWHCVVAVGAVAAAPTLGVYTTATFLTQLPTTYASCLKFYFLWDPAKAGTNAGELWVSIWYCSPYTRRPAMLGWQAGHLAHALRLPGYCS